MSNAVTKFQSVTKGRNLRETMATAIILHVDELAADSSQVAQAELARLSLVLTEWDDWQESLWEA